MRSAAALLALLALAACETGTPRRPVTSHLSGSVAIADSAADVRAEDFVVLVLDEQEADTLGFAPVDASGAFSLEVRAHQQGVFPLVLAYRGRHLRVDDLAVAEGDSATVGYTFPVTSRHVRIRSRENDAWTAYRNAKAHYDGALREALGRDDAMAHIERTTMQTSSILWSLREIFPGTIAEQIASAESIVLLDGWNDSLLVARAGEMTPGRSGYVTTARVARRAEARLRGQRSAIKLLESFRDRGGVQPEAQAALQAEIVSARLDSLQSDAATVAARELRKRYPRSGWAEWAARAEYEAANLMPGQQAPTFSATSDEGRTVRLDSLRGRFVVLEFFVPGNEAFQQQLDARLELQRALREHPVTFVSVSVDPDSLMTRAFFSQVRPPGPRIEVRGGLEAPLARQFNIHALPTRYLIDPDGRIRARYVGPLVPQLTQDLLTLLRIG